MDPRLTPARADLAASWLEGRVDATRFAEPVRRVVAQPTAPLTRTPDGTAPLDSELLVGEIFLAFEEEGLWAWGQAERDGYVGYVPRPCLEPEGPAPTHRVAVPVAHVYAEAKLKSRPAGWAGYGAPLAIDGETREKTEFLRLTMGGFVPAHHLRPLAAHAGDWVVEAERLLHAPYLWGGRSAMGLDCSALIQLAMEGAGLSCPRDSDMQQAALGETLAADGALRRGDLVFWAGHVGVMVTPERLLHANAHHMAAAIEPLAEAKARIAAAGEGPVTRIARLS